jgi:hypothetical protein
MTCRNSLDVYLGFVLGERQVKIIDALTKLLGRTPMLDRSLQIEFESYGKPLSTADRLAFDEWIRVQTAAERVALISAGAAAIAALVAYYSVQFYRFAVEPAQAHTTERTR